MLTWNKLDYDIILANINRNVLEELIPKFKRTKATVILSGLLKTDYKFIESKFSVNKLKVTEKISKNEWICLVL